jgi:hypothetical protein
MNRRNLLTISAATALGLALLAGSAVAQQNPFKEQPTGTRQHSLHQNQIGKKPVVHDRMVDPGRSPYAYYPIPRNAEYPGPRNSELYIWIQDQFLRQSNGG